MMEPIKFQKSITDIFKIACIDLPKAVSETGYMPNYYEDSEYQKLLDTITKLSKVLKDEIFENSAELKDKEWIAKAMMPEYNWLFSLSTIRERVFKDAYVPERHINEEEAHKLLTRLKQQQDKIKEQALNEEKEEKQKEQVLLNWLDPES